MVVILERVPGSGRSSQSMFRVLERRPDEGPGTTFPDGSNPSGRQAGDRYVYEVAPGVRWEYVWDAGAGVWAWIGGPPLRDEDTTDVQVAASTAYQSLGSGPTVTVPLAGDYSIEHGAYIDLKDNAPTYQGWASVKLGAAATSDGQGANAVKFLPTSTAQHQTVFRLIKQVTLAAGDVVVCQYRQDALVPTRPSFRLRHLKVTPIWHTT